MGTMITGWGNDMYGETWTLRGEGECQICYSGEGEKVICSECLNRWDRSLFIYPEVKFISDDYVCPDPIRTYATKVKVKRHDDGKRQRRPNEHLKAPAGPVRELPSEVPSATGEVGAGAVKWYYYRGITPVILNTKLTEGITPTEEWPSESFSGGEGAS